MKLVFYNAAVADRSANGALFDRCVEWRQHLGGAGYAARFVHVEFVFDEVGLCSDKRPIPALLGGGALAIQSGDANGSLCYSSSPRDGGVRFKWIDLTDGKWVLVNLGCLRGGEIAQALMFCEARLGLACDWLGMLGFALPFGEHEDGDRFCSESSVEVMRRSVVATALPKRIADAVMPLVAWRTDPARLYQTVAPTSAVRLGGPSMQGAHS